MIIDEENKFIGVRIIGCDSFSRVINEIYLDVNDQKIELLKGMLDKTHDYLTAFCQRQNGKRYYIDHTFDISTDIRSKSELLDNPKSDYLMLGYMNVTVYLKIPFLSNKEEELVYIFMS